MKLLLTIISFSLLLSQQLLVDGNLKVEGNIDTSGNPITNLGAQQDVTENMNTSEKLILYENNRKKISIAMGLNLFPFPFSSIGFGYIKDWKRGLLYDGIYLINLGILSYTYENKFLFKNLYSSDKQFWSILFLTNIALYFYKSYDLIIKTKEYNNDLYKSIMRKEQTKISFNNY